MSDKHFETVESFIEWLEPQAARKSFDRYCLDTAPIYGRDTAKVIKWWLVSSKGTSWGGKTYYRIPAEIGEALATQWKRRRDKWSSPFDYTGYVAPTTILKRLQAAGQDHSEVLKRAEKARKEAEAERKERVRIRDRAKVEESIAILAALLNKDGCPVSFREAVVLLETHIGKGTQVVKTKSKQFASAYTVAESKEEGSDRLKALLEGPGREQQLGDWENLDREIETRMSGSMYW